MAETTVDEVVREVPMLMEGVEWVEPVMVVVVGSTVEEMMDTCEGSAIHKKEERGRKV